MGWKKFCNDTYYIGIFPGKKLSPNYKIWKHASFCAFIEFDLSYLKQIEE